MVKPLIQVSEWQPLVLPFHLDNPKIRQRILRAGETKVGDVFRMRRNQLFARDLVGLLDAGPLQVQIVPKLYDDSSFEDDAAVLFHLLARLIAPEKVAVLPSSAKISNVSVMEPIYRQVANDLYRMLLDGVPRRYYAIDAVASTIRGRIDLTKVIRQHPGTHHLIPIRFSPLFQDNPLSRVLRAIAERLSNLTRIAKTRETLLQCSDILREAARVPFTPELVNNVNLTRLEFDSLSLIRFAQLLVAGMTHDIARTGDHQGYGLVFPLDGLFEGLVKATIKRALGRSEELRLRGSKGIGRLLRRNVNGIEVFRLKPDLVIEYRASGKIALIGDAKWKRLDHKKSTLGIDATDVYQLMAYMSRTEIASGVFFFPKAERDGPVLRQHFFESLVDRKDIIVVEVDVEALTTKNLNSQEHIDRMLRGLFEDLVRRDVVPTA